MPPRIWILWALFLIRGGFYCAMLPLWEGWDEYAHFAYLQHIVNNKGALPRFDTPVSREIDESMRLAPLAYELRELGPPYLTNEQWWALPAAEREDRRLRPMPLKFSNCPVVARTRRTAKLVGQVSDLPRILPRSCRRANARRFRLATAKLFGLFCMNRSQAVVQRKT